jgi:predicted nuclease of restriction endonuclease-like (RecB) superfamily
MQRHELRHALMRVTDADARHFYEAEAVRANWSRRDLER